MTHLRLLYFVSSSGENLGISVNYTTAEQFPRTSAWRFGTLVGSGGYGMNIIKLILALLGLVFGVMVVLWVLGFVWSLIWYLMFFGIIGAIGYGGYKLF